MDSQCRHHLYPATDPEQTGRETPRHRNSSVDYDAELRKHNEVLRRACSIGPRDHILDIGCGTGQTTRDAARLAVAGSALGVDISAAMIERARELTRAAGVHNANFEQGDAGTYHFPSHRFDIAISRFGTMFFADPVAGFRNVARALQPGGRLVMMVWRAHTRNEWSVAIQRALAGARNVPPKSAGAPDPFSLADRTKTKRILRTAGFTDPAFIAVHERVYYGADAAAAFEWIRGFSCVKNLLQQLDPASTEAGLERLRQTLTAHASAEGVWFHSQAWIVAARRP